MRPKIPPYLDDEIGEIYSEAGYPSKTAFIKDAIRAHIERTRERE